ncbi:hypothetical protein EJ04DRAFT_446473 [Polyplosphaeria fusca]|uniref:Uncharacterized protein n=1 Tax=Polyplosphaeria fusca TaxID=682080 RepID=A0A9P4UZ35_9PLEO|nr:hypothetical protein EJ04DRAFT_446473 [Polyplosphaeria fusca]
MVLLAIITSFLTALLHRTGYEWSRNRSASSPTRSPANPSSPMYPERQIAPLPKRRLRARLSPEQADSIVFPPAPASTAPLFNFPYSPAERVQARRGESDHHACQCGAHHSEVESEEEEDDRAGLPSSPSYHYTRSVAGKPATAGANVYRKPGSTSSSADGYESFENTNNKKKRKIPNMGSNGAHHSNLSAELASMGLSQPHETTILEDGDGPSRYYGSAPSTPQHNNSGTGISGAGRGRFGRSASGRSERRVLGTSNNLANAKASTKRPADQGGIISTAIANAQATPAHVGNENVSLLQQEASKSSTSKGQFTFTCESETGKMPSWPGPQNGQYPTPPGAYPTTAGAAPAHTQSARSRVPVRADAPMVSTQATQTSPNINGAPHPPSAKNGRGQKGVPGGQQAPRKPRRSASKLYALAARKRRVQQEYANFHNPPASPWICEFCEYEDIFGMPPTALIRQYEMKDRKERKRLAEKKRLLEKARMKGRKGKKASKKAQNNAQQNQNPPPGGYDRRMDDGTYDGQEEDYYEDDFDDVSPPKTCDHPGCPNHHSHKGQMPAPGDPRGIAKA